MFSYFYSNEKLNDNYIYNDYRYNMNKFINEFYESFNDTLKLLQFLTFFGKLKNFLFFVF